MSMPDIPRLYTALAECLAVMLYAQSLPRRFSRKVWLLQSALWVLGLGLFLQQTGSVPLVWWIPAMMAAVGGMFLYLWSACAASPLTAGYFCARAFLLAEFAASVEWQLHCWLWPERGGGEPCALLLMAAVYTAVYGLMYRYERRRQTPAAAPAITVRSALAAAAMAGAAFAVSNLAFLEEGEVTMSMLSIRTLVDVTGVLVLSIQHEQLRETALQRELTAMDNVLRRQYEQYQQSRESIRLINRSYHDLKLQIAAIRAERSISRQDAALAEIESGLLRYEAQNKTGNPVLDTLLTAKALYCQQHGIGLTCVADGQLLNFLSTGEICTVVGTALDNATESVSAEPDPEKRLIRVAVYAQNGFVMLRFENYCAAPVALGLDGLPRSNTHGGYDLKSVRAAAEQRGGTMTLHWENGWFTLRVLLPQPVAH